MYQDLHITLPKELLKRVDDYCKENGFRRSEFLRAILRGHFIELNRKKDEK